MDKLMDRAWDELFSHINRCGVLQASPEDQKSWMAETIDYIAERYPDLGDPQLDALTDIGLRFCQPAISRNQVLNRAAEEENVAGDDTAPESIEAEAVEVEQEEATVA